MAGEENVTAAASPTSVPIAGGRTPASAAASAAIHESAAPDHGRSNLTPYDTHIGWRPWPALGMVALISFVSTSIAIGGSLALARSSLTNPEQALKSGKLLVFMLAAQVAMIIGALLAARAKRGDVVSALALKAPAGGLRTYATAMAAMLGVVGIYTAVTYLIMGHDPKNDLAEMVGMFRGNWWPVALLVIGVGAPLSEELLFRGFLQSALVPSRLGYWGATAVTTAIWTALHAGYSIVGMVEVFIIGIVFAIILRLTGSLRVPIVCHAIYNTGIALLLIFAPKDWLGF